MVSPINYCDDLYFEFLKLVVIKAVEKNKLKCMRSFILMKSLLFSSIRPECPF